METLSVDQIRALLTETTIARTNWGLWHAAEVGEDGRGDPFLHGLAVGVACTLQSLGVPTFDPESPDNGGMLRAAYRALSDELAVRTA